MLIDLARARAFGNQESVVEDLLEIGRLQGEAGRLNDAERWLKEASTRAHELGHEFLIAHSDLQVGALFLQRDQFEEARLMLEGAVGRLLQQSAPKHFLTDALLRLAVANDKLGFTDDAVNCLKQAAQVAESDNDGRRKSFALIDLGGLAYRQKHYQEAERYWRAALDLCRRRRDLPNTAKVTFFLGVASSRLGRIDEGRRLVEESRDLYKRLGRQDFVTRSEEWLVGQ